MLRGTNTPSTMRRRAGAQLRVCRPLALTVLLVAAATLARAQQSGTQYDQGTPPQHKAGVSALGSYTSADLGTVSLSNGSLNFSIPVGTVGGRGFWLPLSLNYSSKVWSSRAGSDFITDPQPTFKSAVWAVYDDPDAPRDRFQKLAPGWTVGAVPTLHARGVGINSVRNNVTGCNEYTSGLVKLTVVLPDKGEVELRDDVRDGQPVDTLQGPNNCRFMDGNRGRRWHATDGSGAVFVSDVDNGVVNGNLNGVFITADGTRYRFDDDPVYSFNGSLNLKEFAHASSVTDRNGNRVLISYQESPLAVTYTDQLGRTTTVEYDATDPATGEALAARVTLPGYGGTPRVYKVKAGTMNQNFATGLNPTLPVYNGDAAGAEVNCSVQSAHTSLFPNSWCGGLERIDTKRVLTHLVLPDNRALSFKYNEFGEVAEVLMPTGGRLTYEYQYVATLPSGNSPNFETHGQQGSDVKEIDRAITKRRVYPDGSAVAAVWSYAYSGQPGIATNGYTTSNGLTEVIARSSEDTSSSANVLLRQKHYFTDAQRYLSALHGGTGYALWSTGLVRRVETLSAGGTAVLAAAESDWSQRACVVWAGACAVQQPANDNRVHEARNILDDGKVGRATTTYDQYNNPKEVAEYDFDGTLKRRTETEYLVIDAASGIDYTGDSVRVLRLPTKQSVFSTAAATSEVARTVFEYDRYADDGSNYILTTYPTIPTPVTGHDTANYGASRSWRGNLTRAGRWLKASNTYSNTYTRYDMLGHAVSLKDPRGNVSSISYADDYGDGSSPGGTAAGGAGPTYALPTLFTSPAPHAGEPAHTARSQYDYSTGLLTGFKNRNGVVSQTLYNDPFDRPTLVKSALGVQGVESHTAMYYAPATALGVTLDKNDVLTAKDQNTTDDAALRSWMRTDGLGRTVKTLTRDPQGDVAARTIYDGLGRVKFTTNPYRSQTAPTDGWTRVSYDLLGRQAEVAAFKGPAGTQPPETGVNADWTGSVVTQYAGPEVTVIDQAAKKRKSVSDALGRLAQVYEDPQGANHLTSYGYDALDNLTTVTQGEQTRTFVYDSLSRLTSATNPEVCQQGPTACTPVPVTYDYYTDGSLFHKTDARGVVTTYVYDALGRATSKAYSDSTPPISYFYDAQALPAGAPGLDRGLSVGRLVAVTYGAGSTTGSYTGDYDALGRPRLSLQRTDTGTAEGLKTYGLGYGYDLAGNLKTETYPSGRVVEARYDAAGRVAGVMNQATGHYYVGGASEQENRILYAAHGAAEQLRLGNGLWEHTTFNSRLQFEQSGLGSPTAIDPAKLRLTYGFGPAGANNGNLRSQRIEGGGLDVTQTYEYDDLNRLQWAEEKAGTVSNWKQVYAYDRFGNRGFAAGTTSPNIQVPDPARNPVFDPATNRIKVTEQGQGDYRYDTAGNLLCEPGRLCVQGQPSLTPYYAYDAENRLRTAGGGYEAGGATYTYDGEGRRVRKAVFNGEVTVFVYDAAERVVAEYSNQAANKGTQYLTQDHLGSTRVSTDAQGNAHTDSVANGSRYDYLPFGEDLSWARPSYSGGNVRKKFGGYERDGETGLDYAGARYYGARHGRFVSPDPLMASGKTGNPQSWNRYTYCYNNPLSLIDPDGMDVRLLDAKARLRVLSTLPKELRAQVDKQIDKDGVLKRGSLDKISSKDANFNDLKTMVNKDSTVDVMTASKDEKGTEFYYKSPEEVRKEEIKGMQDAGMDEAEIADTLAGKEPWHEARDGKTLDASESPTKNILVIVADGTGKTADEPESVLATTTSHELYGHAFLAQQGKPWMHNDPGVKERIGEVVTRTQKLYQPDPQQVKPQKSKP